MIDFIGDIHGHADELEALLKKLGYSIKNGNYHHSDRTVMFIGDYIDRGPKIVETLQIVRRMVDAGDAIALMGNHEYNAICFHMKNKKGVPLRLHLPKNIHQHKKTIEQFHSMSKGKTQFKEYIDWFKTLPLFYEGINFRAVHACWDINNITFLKKRLKHGKLNDNFFWGSVQKGSKLFVAIDETLKGKEIPVPLGHLFEDPEQNTREEMRIKWWADPITTSYRELSFPRVDTLPDKLVDKSVFKSPNYYTDKVPVFFGHYRLKGKIKDYGSNICCLDYSVAKDGVLAAYRFDGEAKVDIEKFVVV